MNPGDADVVDLVLPSGHVATVDVEDWPLIAPYRWCVRISHGQPRYASRNTKINGKWTKVDMHRLFVASQPGQQIDHANGNGLDNRRTNLRLATPSQNRANSRYTGNKSTVYKGVSQRVGRATYQAYLYREGKKVCLGSFACPKEAARAYDRAAREQWGEFAYTNFPLESEAS